MAGDSLAKFCGVRPQSQTNSSLSTLCLFLRLLVSLYATSGVFTERSWHEAALWNAVTLHWHILLVVCCSHSNHLAYMGAHTHTHTHTHTHACTFTVYMPTRTHSGTWQVAFPFLTFSLYNILATAGLSGLVVCMCSDTSAMVLIWAKWVWIDDKFLFMFLLPITDLSVRFWWKIIHDIMG